METPYLLTRQQAAERYGISQRELDNLYRRDASFPVLRVGRKVLIHRERADAYFTQYIGGAIETK